MSAVRKWTLFLRAVIVAITVLAVGVLALRAGVIEQQRLGLWPTFEILHLDRFQGRQPLRRLAEIALTQVAIWTLLAYFFFIALDAVRRGSSRRPRQ